MAFNKHNLICILSSILAYLYSIMAYSQPETVATKQANIDKILSNVIPKILLGTDKVVNLGAQPILPIGVTDINSFNDFIAIGVRPSQEPTETILVNFNQYYGVINIKPVGKPWIGVSQFEPKELKQAKFSLEEGLSRVKNYIRIMKINVLPNQVTNVVIYKSLQKQQMIYDYSFKISPTDNEHCQEVLFEVDTGQISMGMQKSCHIYISNIKQGINGRLPGL